MKKGIAIALLVAIFGVSTVAIVESSFATTKKEQQKGTAQYGCPMCPEVASDKPGKCPTCGMNLEKKKPVTK